MNQSAEQLQPAETADEAERQLGMVAIVDDDPHISRALGSWLELNDLRATHHSSAESLLQAIHQADGQLQLHLGVVNPLVFPLVGAVLDLNLPGATGIELATRLRAMAPGLPLVIITALRDEERSSYGQPPPGIRILKKPFDLDDLENALFPLVH
ncbi:MAG: response regulator [Gammaproteobacteria bacterium]|nr:response regulator [Gammaproteobacteria bacterium]